ncbi:uncharacterized protein LOC144937569 [Lampetra fluviatilis]
MAKLDALLAASLLLAALWLHGVTLSCGAVQRWVPSTQRERWPQADDFVGLMGKRSYDYSDDTFDGLMGRRSAKPVGAGHAGSPSYERFQDSGRARATLGRLVSYLATSDRHPRINGSRP